MTLPVLLWNNGEGLPRRFAPRNDVKNNPCNGKKKSPSNDVGKDRKRLAEDDCLPEQKRETDKIRPNLKHTHEII